MRREIPLCDELSHASIIIVPLITISGSAAKGFEKTVGFDLMISQAMEEFDTYNAIVWPDLTSYWYNPLVHE